LKSALGSRNGGPSGFSAELSAGPGESLGLTPPRLGEYTVAVLRELGYSTAPIEGITVNQD
jgi:hypothetical protein